jgi:hypothetical protein
MTLKSYLTLGERVLQEQWEPLVGFYLEEEE